MASATVRSSIGTALIRSPRYETVALDKPDSRQNELEICFRYDGHGRVSNPSSLINLYSAGEVFCQVIAVHNQEVEYRLDCGEPFKSFSCSIRNKSFNERVSLISELSRISSSLEV